MCVACSGAQICSVRADSAATPNNFIVIWFTSQKKWLDNEKSKAERIMPEPKDGEPNQEEGEFNPYLEDDFNFMNVFSIPKPNFIF